MIVVITGTSGPFQRLVDAAAELMRSGGEKVWIQHGDAALPEGIPGAPTISREEMLSKIREADVVICHGGSGTILDVRRGGLKPVVMPRKAALGEHVNDHQSELAQELERAGAVIAVSEPHELKPAVEKARAAGRRAPDASAGNALRQAVAEDATSIATRRRSGLAAVLRSLTRAPQSRVR